MDGEIGVGFHAWPSENVPGKMPLKSVFDPNCEKVHPPDGERGR